FYALLRDQGIDDKHCLHFDVSDFANSIPVPTLLAGLPSAITADAPLLDLLTRTLCRKEVIRNGRVIEVEQKGVMPGTPLSGMLSNLYLKDLDETFRAAGVTYARYGDDIIVFAPEPEIRDYERLIRSHLEAKGLKVNEEKTQLLPPGLPWEYLG